MSFFLKRFFGKKETPDRLPQEESFTARFHRFKLFLSAQMDGYSQLMTFEERLAEELPVGMPFLRTCAARIGIASMQSIRQLQALSGKKYVVLNEKFQELRQKIQDILNSEARSFDGPLLLSYDQISEDHRFIIAPNIIKLHAVRQSYPEFIPQGFIVSGAAWWRFINLPALHDEIDRIMLISQDDPNSYHEASITIRERIIASFVLPADLLEELEKTFLRLKEELAKPGYCLLIRTLPVQSEHGALILPEQVVNTPIFSADVLAEAVVRAFTLLYRPRAMIYRLKLGIRDRSMPVCICFAILPAEQARGGAYRHLDTRVSDELIVRIRRNYTSAPGEPSLDASSLPEGMQEKLREKSALALTCLADAPVQGKRHELYWVADAHGNFFILGAVALPDPETATMDTPLPDRKTMQYPDALHEGGKNNYPGLAYGEPFLVRNFRDALHFPIGGILLLNQAAPRWSFLLDFASGAIAGDGSGAGPFAQIARRYGRPTLLGYPYSLDDLHSSGHALLVANIHRQSAVYICPESEAEESAEVLNPHAQLVPLEKQIYDLCEQGRIYKAHTKGHGHEEGHLWLSTSEVAAIARGIAPLLAALTLPDSDSSGFRAEYCKTFHDFLDFCQYYAVREMFQFSTSKKSSQTPAKQLVCQVPMQFWIVNLDDGFYGDISGPTVKLEEIASIPMRTFWEGFSDKPWDGPPQLNAKGFLSVLFEATQNPNLDPASGASHYTEKNVFLIAKRFCSMRCRFGFHFLSLDCFFSERPRERFIVFQFKGGAANLMRRIRRVHFVAELLAQFECSTEVVGDTLTARMEGGEDSEFLRTLRVIGYLVMHTRQLDMIMTDEEELAIRRLRMLEDMLALASRPPLILP